MVLTSHLIGSFVTHVPLFIAGFPSQLCFSPTVRQLTLFLFMLDNGFNRRPAYCTNSVFLQIFRRKHSKHTRACSADHLAFCSYDNQFKLHYKPRFEVLRYPDGMI